MQSLTLLIPIELEEMCAKIKSQKLRNVILEVELVPACCSILVSNIEEEWYEADVISIYFNNEKKSGGGSVQEVHLKGSGEAIVTFKNSKGMFYLALMKQLG